jgi:hypothetical protein
MAVLASQLVFWAWGDVRWHFGQWVFVFAIVPYMVFWTLMALLLKHQPYFVAAALGLLSPLVGTSFFLVGGWAIAVEMWYIVFPMGIVTGILVKACVSVGG